MVIAISVIQVVNNVLVPLTSNVQLAITTNKTKTMATNTREDVTKTIAQVQHITAIHNQDAENVINIADNVHLEVLAINVVKIQYNGIVHAFSIVPRILTIVKVDNNVVLVQDIIVIVFNVIKLVVQDVWFLIIGMIKVVLVVVRMVHIQLILIFVNVYLVLNHV